MTWVFIPLQLSKGGKWEFILEQHIFFTDVKRMSRVYFFQFPCGQNTKRLSCMKVKKYLTPNSENLLKMSLNKHKHTLRHSYNFFKLIKVKLMCFMLRSSRIPQFPSLRLGVYIYLLFCVNTWKSKTGRAAAAKWLSWCYISLMSCGLDFVTCRSITLMTPTLREATIIAHCTSVSTSTIGSEVKDLPGFRPNSGFCSLFLISCRAFWDSSCLLPTIPPSNFTLWGTWTSKSILKVSGADMRKMFKCQ